MHILTQVYVYIILIGFFSSVVCLYYIHMHTDASYVHVFY